MRIGVIRWQDFSGDAPEVSTNIEHQHRTLWNSLYSEVYEANSLGLR